MIRMSLPVVLGLGGAVALAIPSPGSALAGLDGEELGKRLVTSTTDFGSRLDPGKLEMLLGPGS